MAWKVPRGVLLSLIVMAFIQGCASAKRVDPQSEDLATTVTRLDIQDARDAANELSQSLLGSGVLGAQGRPSRIAVDSFVNATKDAIDRDEVLKKIRVALNKAGVAQTMTTLDDKGNVAGESNIASKAARERLRNDQIDAFLNDEEAPEAIYPDFAVTFKILDDRVATGIFRTNKQVTYTFQMSLTDVKKGVAVWEGEVQITKQGGVLQK